MSRIVFLQLEQPVPSTLISFMESVSVASDVSNQRTALNR